MSISIKPIVDALTRTDFKTRLELSFAPMQNLHEHLNGDDVYALTSKFQGIDELVEEVKTDIKRLEADPSICSYGLHVLELIQSPSERSSKLLRYGKSIRKYE